MYAEGFINFIYFSPLFPFSVFAHAADFQQTLIVFMETFNIHFLFICSAVIHGKNEKKA